MIVPQLVERWRRALTGILGVVARPVRAAQGGSGAVLEPYRGYGSRSEIFLIGRVFRQSQPDRRANDAILSQLRDIGRRLARRSISGAVVTARFGGTEERVTTDHDGYFRVHLRPRTEPSADCGWHTVDLILEQPQLVEARGEVFIPPEHCRYVVISD